MAAVLLYGSKSWVLPPSGLSVLGEFYVEVTRRMTGTRPTQRTVGAWLYLKSADVLAAACLKLIVTYITWRQHSIAKTIKGQPLLEEYRGEKRKRGNLTHQFWWE